MPELELQRLTLVYPPTLEDTLVEVLLEQDCPGVTTVAGAGHGADFSRASTAEQVRGRVARGLLVMVVPASSIEGLLAHLAARVRHPEVVWWRERVEGFGTLA